jgi:hypothetical protein
VQVSTDAQTKKTFRCDTLSPSRKAPDDAMNEGVTWWSKAKAGHEKEGNNNEETW